MRGHPTTPGGGGVRFQPRFDGFVTVLVQIAAESLRSVFVERLFGDRRRIGRAGRGRAVRRSRARLGRAAARPRGRAVRRRRGGGASPRRAARPPRPRGRGERLRAAWRRGPRGVRRAPAAAAARSSGRAFVGERAPRPSVLVPVLSLQQQVQGQAVLAGDGRQLADDRDHQALAMHVGALHGHGFDLAGGQLRELLLLLLVDGTVVRRRPCRLRELVLLVADQFGKRGVQLAELAVEAQDRHRLGGVVEPVPRLALDRPGALHRGLRRAPVDAALALLRRPGRAAARTPR